MIFFDISDTSIEAVRLSTSFLSGEAINAFGRVEFENGPVKSGEIKDKDALGKVVANLLEKAKPKAMRDQECAFTLPDKRVYTHRFNLSQRRDSQTVLELIKDQAEKLIPHPMEELNYDYRVLGDKKKETGAGEILLTAAPKTLVESYKNLFADLDLSPKFAVPESFAAYQFISPLIGGEGTALYLDVGGSVSIAALMDGRGVVEAFSEPVQTSDLFSGIKRLLKFSDERLGREIGLVVLGGGGSLKIKRAEAKQELGVDVISAEDAVGRFKLKIRVNFGNLSPITFANVLGLALLSKEESSLNLLHT